MITEEVSASVVAENAQVCQQAPDVHEHRRVALARIGTHRHASANWKRGCTGWKRSRRHRRAV
jgi:hypothetical protein